MKEILTPDEVAAKLHVTTRTLARWRHDGVGPDAIKTPRRVYYWAEDVEDYLDAVTRQYGDDRPEVQS